MFKNNNNLIRLLTILMVSFFLSFFTNTVTASQLNISDTTSLEEISISTIQQEMDEGNLTSEELLDYYLERIEKYDKKGPSINSIITINDNAIELAKDLDKERAAGEVRGPLHGVPIVVKDNYNTIGMPTSGGSLSLKDSMTPNDAFQVKKLKDAGAIILAKTNLHEFAFGITTISSLGGQTLNPYNLSHNPGGSSGGTGASVASNLAVAGFGTDTGGSIRLPAAFNNLVGIRTTMGLSSRDGIIPLALTQDTAGPMARSVEDIAYLLDATVGYDVNDVITAKSINNYPKTYTESLNVDGLNGAKIGVVRELFNKKSTETNELIDQAIKDMETIGAEVVNVKIENLNEIISYPSLSSWEFKFQLNDYLESLGDLAPYKSLTEIIDSGQYSKSIERSLIQRNERESLDNEEYKDIVLFRSKASENGLLKTLADNQLDALVYPTSTNPPAIIGEGQNSGSNNRLSAFSGFPAISVPAGFTSDGLPVGIEFLSRPFEESTLIEFAYAYEQKTKHRTPPILGESSDKIELENRLKEINGKNLNENVYTRESWGKLLSSITKAKKVLNDDTASQEEIKEALEDLNIAYDGLTIISISKFKKLVEDLADEGKFVNEKASRNLIMHLSAIELLEKQGKTEKMVKHLNSFKQVIKDQMENELISKETYELLDIVADHLAK